MNENPFIHHTVTPMTIPTIPRETSRSPKWLIAAVKEEAKENPDAVWYVYIGSWIRDMPGYCAWNVLEELGPSRTVSYQPKKDNPPIKSMKGRCGIGIMKSDKRTDPYELFRNARPDEITWIHYSGLADSDIFLEANEAVYYRDYGRLARIMVTLATQTPPKDFGRTLSRSLISWTRTIDILTRVGGFQDHVDALKEDEMYYIWTEDDEKEDNTDMIINIPPVKIVTT